MKKYGIGATSLCGMFGSDDRDLSADNADTAIRYLADSVDFAAKLGASTIILVPSPVGRTAPPADIPFERLWANAVRNIRKAADYAQGKGVRFVVEAINRYETYFVNTLTKAWKSVQEIDHPAVGIMADTFHMNLEENDFGRSLRMIAPKLWHVHIADNTREPAGMGRTDFKELLLQLREIGFQGSVAMEFMPRLANPYGSQGMETASELMDAYAYEAGAVLYAADGTGSGSGLEEIAIQKADRCIEGHALLSFEAWPFCYKRQYRFAVFCRYLGC